MITDEQVRKLYEMAGYYTAEVVLSDAPYVNWQLVNAEDTPVQDLWTNTQEESWGVFISNCENDPRDSLDAAFMLLDAIAPQATLTFWYDMNGLMCKISTPTSSVMDIDPYRPDYTPSRALAMTAAMLLIGSERKAQS